MPQRPPNQNRQLLHATAVAIDGHAALLVGPSGSGKSDLALRLVMAPYHDAGRALTVTLIADDQVLLERHGQTLLASAPPTIAGRMEVRGLGIVAMAAGQSAGYQVRLIADLDQAKIASRFPDPHEIGTLLGLDLPLIRLDARQASAPAKLILALLRLPLP